MFIVDITLTLADGSVEKSNKISPLLCYNCSQPNFQKYFKRCLSISKNTLEVLCLLDYFKGKRYFSPKLPVMFFIKELLLNCCKVRTVGGPGPWKLSKQARPQSTSYLRIGNHWKFCWGVEVSSIDADLRPALSCDHCDFFTIDDPSSQRECWGDVADRGRDPQSALL